MRILSLVVSTLLLVTSVHAAEAPPKKSRSDRAGAAVAAPLQFSRGTPLPKWTQPLAQIPATVRTDPVVMRLMETQVSAGPHGAILLNRAIQVNDKSALGAIGQFGISYFPAYQKLSLHRVAILRAGQMLERTASVNTRVLERETGIDAGMYGGAATLQLLLDDVRVGDTLWLTYTLEGDNPVLGKQWADDFSWDAAAPVERRSLTVFHPRGRPLYWRQLGDFRRTPVQPVHDVVGNIERLHFEETAIEAVEMEPSTPSDYLPERMLQMSEYADWHGVAQWADSLFPKAMASPALKALAAQFQKEPTAAARAGAALQWVQNEIRYFSVSIGENSHRPQAPETVIKLRYGDCKDKSYLLVSLLSQLDIEALPVLLSSRAPGMPAKMLPSPTWFDHVIVRIRIDGRDYYVDPTRSGQKLALDQLSTPFPGAAALPVDAAATALLVLPQPPAGLPEYEHVEKLVIAAFDGDAMLETREFYRGAYAEAARVGYPTLSPAEFRKSMLEKYENLYPGVTLMDAPRFEDHLERNTFELIARYQLPKPVTHKDGKYAIDYDSRILDGTLGIPKKIVRNYPFALPMGKYAARYRLNIEWPATLRVHQQVAPKTIDNPFFRIQEEYTLRGNVLDYLLDYQVRQEQITAAELPALQVQAKQLNQFANATFGVSDTMVSSPAISHLSFRDLDTLAVVENAGTSMAAFKVDKDRNIDFSRLCDVAMMAIRLRTVSGKQDSVFDEVERDLAREKAPGSGLCMARVLFAHGEFSNSVPLYRAAALADDSPYLRDQAWAEFYAGHGATALRTMARYRIARRQENHEDGLAVADEIALSRRLGQPVSEALLRHASEIADGPWPRPLLAMQAGLISPEELIRLAEAMPPDTRTLALNDAWFYIGQQCLAENDRAGAKQAFLWFAVDGLRSSVLYEQANVELERLNPTDDNYRSALLAFRRGDHATAIAKWRASAEAGVAAGQRELGILYFYGKHIPQDNELAMKWLRLAAVQEDPAGCNMLGQMYENGMGVAVDQFAAAAWYRRGAINGSGYARFNLGWAYLKGEGVEKNMEQAFFYLRQSAEQGNSSAQNRLARFYLSGLVVKPDYAKAFLWNTRSANQSDTDGMFDLGKMYEYGTGVLKDKAEMFRWYKAAAEQGSAPAQLNLGFSYEYGQGIGKDEKLAEYWYKKASLKGDNFSKFRLGLLYRKTGGGLIDLDTSMKLLEESASAGVTAAQAQLGNIYFVGSHVPIDMAKAFSYYKESADGEFSHAQMKLGIMYHFGTGVDKNFPEAVMWYRKAAAQGESLAMNNLADMYENGQGVPQDYAQALTLYRQAAIKGEAIAMVGLSNLYETGKGLSKDLSMAYTYCRLGVVLGQKDQVAKCDALSPQIAPADVQTADLLVAGWKNDMPLPGVTAK